MAATAANAKGLERLRRIRAIDERHHLTLMCRDLSEMAKYAIVDDAQFKLMKSATPGSYTFILRARREVPRRLTRKKTIGVRVPAHPVAHALLAELDQPMLSTTLLLPGEPSSARRKPKRCAPGSSTRWTWSSTPGRAGSSQAR